MIYEYRKYVAAPGKLASVHKMFAEPITRLFERHGMDVLAYWSPVVGGSSVSDLHYILKWADMTAMQQSWANFYADPEWAIAVGEFQSDGPLLSETENQVWALTPYSPVP